MSARLAIPVAAVFGLAACATPAAEIARAVTPEETGLLGRCEGNGWSIPARPVRIFANVYDVGTCGITALLLTSEAGHVLIDGTTEAGAPHVAENIRRLGFALDDVEWIVTSHEHFDHVGGVAELQRLTGARIAATAKARPLLESGRPDPADPQAARLDPFPGIKVDRVLADGETLGVGEIRITPHPTPAHSPGSTSWTWRSCAGDNCRDIAHADSLTTISADGYRFTDHPERVTQVRQGIATVAALHCDILLTPHPGASRMHERLAGAEPLVDPAACRRYAERARDVFGERLERERRGAAR